MPQIPAARLALARRIAMDYSTLPQIEAVALAGSQSTGTAGPDSDFDFYVYVREEIPMPERRRIAATSASRAEVGNQFWEPGDEWVDNETKIHDLLRVQGWEGMVAPERVE